MSEWALCEILSPEDRTVVNYIIPYLALSQSITSVHMAAMDICPESHIHITYYTQNSALFHF